MSHEGGGVTNGAAPSAPDRLLSGAQGARAFRDSERQTPRGPPLWPREAYFPFLRLSAQGELSEEVWRAGP